MDVFKKNPVFSALLALFILLFIGGIVMIVMIQGQVQAEQKKVERAKQSLNMALALEPAPTQANVDLAKSNVEALKSELDKRVESTLGNKPDLMDKEPPATGTQMLFQLNAYANEFAKVASRTIPVGNTDSEIEKMKAEGETLPSTDLPPNFAFGFSRYIDSGKPPADADVPMIFKQSEILTYVLRKLFNTRPISIVSVQRGPVELPPPDPNVRNPTNSLKADEFRIGSESAGVEGAVQTLGFKIVFTGYTENLRSFLKQIEEFEIPLVVRSVEAAPQEGSVSVAARTGPAAPANNPFDLFGGVGGDDEEPQGQEQQDKAREPLVAENISEFTVVLEYITVKFTDQSANVDSEDEEGEENS